MSCKTMWSQPRGRSPFWLAGELTHRLLDGVLAWGFLGFLVLLPVIGMRWQHVDQQSGADRETPGLLTSIPMGAIVRSLAFSPGSERLAVADMAGSIRICDQCGQREETLPSVPSNLFQSSLFFAHDGRLVALPVGPLDESDAWIWDQGSWQERFLPGLQGRSRIAVSGDGRFLAVLCPLTNTIRVWRWPSCERRLILQGNADSLTAMAFSPDSLALASLDIGGVVRIANTSSGQEQNLFPTGMRYACSLAYSPDGTQVATASVIETVVRFWDVVSGEPRGDATIAPSGISEIAFTPDGSLLLVAATNGTLCFVETETRRVIASLKASESTLWQFAISPDGRSLAIASNLECIVHVWDLAAFLEAKGIRFEKAAGPQTVAARDVAF